MPACPGQSNHPTFMGVESAEILPTIALYSSNSLSGRRGTSRLPPRLTSPAAVTFLLLWRFLSQWCVWKQCGFVSGHPQDTWPGQAEYKVELLSYIQVRLHQEGRRLLRPGGCPQACPPPILCPEAREALHSDTWTFCHLSMTTHLLLGTSLPLASKLNLYVA